MVGMQMVRIKTRFIHRFILIDTKIKKSLTKNNNFQSVPVQEDRVDDLLLSAKNYDLLNYKEYKKASPVGWPYLFYDYMSTRFLNITRNTFRALKKSGLVK